MQVVHFRVSSSTSDAKILFFQWSEKQYWFFRYEREGQITSYWPGLSDLYNFILSGGNVIKGH